MKQKSLILMSTLLVCSLESFAQSDVEKPLDMEGLRPGKRYRGVAPNRW